MVMSSQSKDLVEWEDFTCQLRSESKHSWVCEGNER